jgi:hypothetical protein
MNPLGVELRRVPLRLRLLATARMHASEHSLDPISAIEDLRKVISRLEPADLANQEDGQVGR